MAILLLVFVVVNGGQRPHRQGWKREASTLTWAAFWFLYLISNAVEYTPESGEIMITGSQNGMAIWNTVDELAPEEVASLFERYWRKDQVRGDSNHVGLGLTLAKECADVVGLSLTAELKGNKIRFQLEPKS